MTLVSEAVADMQTAISGLPNDLRKFEKIRHLL
jgi:hypothetical protein